MSVIVYNVGKVETVGEFHWLPRFYINSFFWGSDRPGKEVGVLWLRWGLFFQWWKVPA